MASGEDATRRGTVDDGRPAEFEAGGDSAAPRRLPSFPFRGVNETGEIPIRGRMSELRHMTDGSADTEAGTDTDEFATVPGAAPRGATSVAATSDEAAPGSPAHPFGEDDDVDPVVTEGEVDESGASEHGPRSAGLIVTVAIMTVLLIAASALIAYLWRVSEAWELQVQEITDTSYGLGEELAAEREALAQAEQSIELLNDQLAASKDTVSRLQAENAQWGDDAAFAQEQIGALQTTIGDATAVANSLSRCIEGHEQLITYLESPDDYDPEQIASFETSVTDLCTAAKDANLALQQAVAQ